MPQEDMILRHALAGPAEAVKDPYLDLLATYALHSAACPGDQDKTLEAQWLDEDASLLVLMGTTTPMTKSGAVAGIAFVESELRNFASAPCHADILARCMEALAG